MFVISLLMQKWVLTSWPKLPWKRNFGVIGFIYALPVEYRVEYKQTPSTAPDEL